MMHQLTYIEEYLYFLYGYSYDTRSGSWSRPWSTRSPNAVSLASYDVDVLDGMTDRADRGVALTDRQAALAIKLIEKYRRQLEKHNVGQPSRPHQFKNGIRTVDRSKSVTIDPDDDTKMVIRFPFEPRIVASLKTLGNQGFGTVAWNPDKKVWEAAITDYTVNAVVAIAQTNNFDIDLTVLGYYETIVEVGNQPTRIVLRKEPDGTPYVENAPKAMQDWLERYVGFDSLLRLADQAGTLGFDIDPEITAEIRATHGEDLLEALAAQTHRIECPQDEALAKAVAYLKTVDRFPAIVYAPGLGSALEACRGVVGEDRVAVVPPDAKVLDMAVAKTLDRSTRPLLYYCNRGVPEIKGTAPAVVSFMNLSYGKTRTQLAGMAEKVIYVCPKLR